MKGTGFKDNIRIEEGSGNRSVVLRVQEAAIAYTDNAKSLMTIPDGAKIHSISVDITTGFNGTTPTYDLGYAADADAVVDGGTLSTTAGRSSFTPPVATAGQWNGVASGKLIGTFVGGGTNTTGAGILKVAYYASV
ncbi:MAG: hypothetical protein A4E53_00150 [Pelotomaculum sp. PtaB.Bin104]|nr:MAG: hypothetical protein A4E53_00150 [Pelotomaculum sp. PtaB.Bin104]